MIFLMLRADGSDSQALRAVALARFLLATAGRAALVRTLPLYLAVGIISVVLFSGNGMDAATLTRQASEDLTFHLALLGSWLLAALPTAKLWLGTPETFLVRALPVSRNAVLAVLALGLVAVHAPWAALWLRGVGVGAAVWAFLVAAALQTSLIGGFRGWSDMAPPALALCAAALGPGAAGTALGAAVFMRSLAVAWSRAPERSAEGRGWVASGGPLRATLTALAVAGARGHAPVAFRSLLLAVGAAWLAVIALGRDLRGELTTTSFCLLFWVPAAVFGASAASKPALQLARSLAWLEGWCGAPARVRAAPQLLVMAAIALLGGLFASIVGASAALDAPSAARLFVASVGAGAATGLLTCSAARRLLRNDGRDGGRLVLASLGSLTTWIVAILELGGRALPLMALVSALWLTWDRLSRPSRGSQSC